MTTGSRHLALHDEVVERHHAARRMSAYVYGNVLVLAAIVSTPPSWIDDGRALGVVFGVVMSTWLAHTFAESLAERVEHHEVRTYLEADLGEARAIINSGVVPIAVFALAWAGLLEPRVAQLAAEAYVIVRIGACGYVAGRLEGEQPTWRSLVSGIVAALVGAIVVALRLLLGH